MPFKDTPVKADSLKVGFIDTSSRLLHGTASHYLFGVSLFNSLFDREYIVRCLTLAQSSNVEPLIYIPDKPYVHTMRALGYSEKEAKRKVSKQLRWTINKVKDAVEPFEIDLDSILHLHSDIQSRERYDLVRQQVQNEYENNDLFRGLCHREAKETLISKNKSDVCHDDIEQATLFLLEEIPVIIASSYILGFGTTLFLYRRAAPVFEHIFQEQVFGVYMEQSGFGTLS